MFRLNPIKFVIFLFIFSVISGTLIHFMGSSISGINSINAKGNRVSLNIPFRSTAEGNVGKLTYNIELNNGTLFSGRIQVLTDDCVNSVFINGTEVRQDDIKGDRCDILNGVNLDLSNYLKKGKNKITIIALNRQGHYGLDVIDMTFYAKYFLASIFLFVIALTNTAVVLRRIKRGVRQYFFKSKLAAGAVVFLLVIFAASVALGPFGLPTTVYRWILIFELISLVSIPLAIYIYQNFIFGKAVAFFFLLMVLICSKYLLNIFYDMFSYDVEGHLEYIRYLIQRGVPPVSSGGWLFYHPSLYYRTVASFWAVIGYGVHYNYEEFLKMMQSFSLVFFIIYSFFSILTVDVFFKQLISVGKITKNSRTRVAYLLVMVVFLLWNTNPIFSVRIGNDILFDLLYAISFCCIVKWWYTGSRFLFLAALFFAALDIWAKSNGFILLGVLGVLLIVRIVDKWKKELTFRPYITEAMLLVLVIACCGFLSFFPRLMSFVGASNSNIVVANAGGIGDDMLVKNTLPNFLTFNPVKFVSIPFTSALDDAKGRQNFWFFLFKTGLFGEFPYKPVILSNLASLLSFGFLCIMVYFLAGLSSVFNKFKILMPFVTGIGVLVTAMIVFRILYPFSCSNDFRYIFPALLPFVVIIGAGLLFIITDRRIFAASAFIIGLFVLLSLSFQVLNVLTV